MQIYWKTLIEKANKNIEEEQAYNKLLTDRELKAAISQQMNTAPRKNTIHSQMKKKNYHQRH